MSCALCKHTELKYYDGWLGYEAMICKKCGAVHDLNGVWLNDELIIKSKDSPKEDLTNHK